MGPALLLGLAMLLAAEVEGPPPLMYSAKPIQGVLVDAQTGEPLMGVIVVAQWIMHEPGKGSWRRLHVFETTTDSRGNYLIPGWGPKRNTWYPWTRLRDRDPEISFFKRGYSPFTIQNRWDRNESMRFSEWDEKTIKLQRFAGTPDEWARELRFLQTDLSWGSEEMDWRRVPRITLALEEERLALEKKHLMGLNISDLSPLGTNIDEVRRFLEGQK
jgi:hypothetical protein